MPHDRFHPPTPKPALMRALGWVNDHFILPRVARVANVRVPTEDDERLRAALDAPFVICPNHPEVFTDWMLDKWICTRFAPLAASWADPLIVNGPARWLWLSNGLVAAVHGDELEHALHYSAQCLVRGHGALIHPEGEVNWDNETVGALRSGAVRIAERGAELAGREAHLVPVSWFIRFRKDATAGLQTELSYVEQALGVAAARGDDPARRLGALYDHLLEREAGAYDIELGPRADGYARRFERGLAHAVRLLSEVWPEHRPATVPDEPRAAARAWHAIARTVDEPSKELRRQIGVIDRMLRLIPAGVGAQRWTQEQVSERLKRLRLDWVRGHTRDEVARFIPRAAAAREVFVRVHEPVALGPGVDQPRVLATMHERMLRALNRAREDGLARLGAPIGYDNPLVV